MKQENLDQPFGTVEEDMLNTVSCENNVCNRRVLESATVDVVTGQIIEKTPKQKTLSGPTGDFDPEAEKWCLHCADEQFGIKRAAGERSIEERNDYLTPINLAFFFGGIIIATIIMSVVTV